MLRPPLVRLRFELWLPILRNSAQHLTMLHFLFSSHGSRAVRRDFNPCIDMLICFPMSCLFIFLFYASRHASPPPTKGRGHRWSHGRKIKIGGIVIHSSAKKSDSFSFDLSNSIRCHQIKSKNDALNGYSRSHGFRTARCGASRCGCMRIYIAIHRIGFYKQRRAEMLPI